MRSTPPESSEDAAPAELSGVVHAAPTATPSAITATRLRIERRRLVGTPEISERRLILRSPHCRLLHPGRATGVGEP